MPYRSPWAGHLHNLAEVWVDSGREADAVLRRTDDRSPGNSVESDGSGGGRTAVGTTHISRAYDQRWPGLPTCASRIRVACARLYGSDSVIRLIGAQTDYIA